MVSRLGSEQGRVTGWWPRVSLGLLILVMAIADPALIVAAEWALINPGETTMDAVSRRYGKPTSATTQKVDGYDSAQWVYEEAQAPTGMIRMVVEFGMLTPKGYMPQVVRSLLLHPKPGTFNRSLVLQGWGPPTATGEQSGSPAYLYEDGLFVVFDEAAWDVKTMLFVPKQQIPPPAAAPPR
jgi:hypothetical protein